MTRIAGGWMRSGAPAVPRQVYFLRATAAVANGGSGQSRIETTRMFYIDDTLFSENFD